MPTAYTRTSVRRKPVAREARVPTAMPAPDRIRLERWVAAGRGVPACRAPAPPGGPGGSWPRASSRPGSGVVDPASCIGQVIRCLRRVSRFAGASHDATLWVRLFVDEMRVVAQPPPHGAVQRGEHEDADRCADEE